MPKRSNIVTIIILMLMREIRIVNLDINPKRGGKPARDRIREIVSRVSFLLVWVNINKWLPVVLLSLLNKGREIII